MKFKIFCLLFVFSVSCNKSNEHAYSVGKENTKIKMAELKGGAIDLSQYAGKAIFINVWATWCGPCITEMPTIESIQGKLKNEKVVFLLASNEDLEHIQNFIKKRNYNFHYVHLENLEELKIQALPATLIFNPNGKLKFFESGFRQWDNPENIELITKIINDNEE